MTEKKIFGISPHIEGFTTIGQSREALPVDSIFATPEGRLATYPINTLVAYADYPQEKRIGYVKSVAHDLIANPERFTLFFEYLQEKVPENYKDAANHLRTDLQDILAAQACADPRFLTEKQIMFFFTMANGSIMSPEDQSEITKAARIVFSGFIDSLTHPKLRGLTPQAIEKAITEGRITREDVQDTQNRTVHFLYTLTTAVLRTHDDTLLRQLYKELSFQGDILNGAKPHSGIYAAAGQSFDDDTLVKFVLLDHTATLLEEMYNPDQKNGIVEQMVYAMKQSPAALSYLQFVQKQTEREKTLQEYYEKRYQHLGQTIALETEDIGEYYTQPLPFPENLIYRQHELWYLYLEYFSKFALEKGMVNSPILPVSLPDGSVRFIALTEGNNAIAAQEVMRYVAEQGDGSEIGNHKVIDSFLTYLKPELSGTTYVGLKRDNETKRDLLTTKISRSLPKPGIHVRIDQKKYPNIASSQISIDRNLKSVQLRIGSYILPLSLNESYELSYADGTPLQIDENSKIWWEHVVLPPLVELVCKPPEEHEGYIEGLDDEPGDTPQEKTRHYMYRRIGHLRNLGLTKNGKEKRHTQQQREKVLELSYPLPRVERLDLDVHNASKPYGEKQTYVLPVERELDEAPVIHLPHAYDSTESLFK